MNEFNHELDAEFAGMDTDKDNLVTEQEMETYVLQQDYDSGVIFIRYKSKAI